MTLSTLTCLSVARAPVASKGGDSERTAGILVLFLSTRWDRDRQPLYELRRDLPRLIDGAWDIDGEPRELEGLKEGVVLEVRIPSARLPVPPTNEDQTARVVFERGTFE